MTASSSPPRRRGRPRKTDKPDHFEKAAATPVKVRKGAKTLTLPAKTALYEATWAKLFAGDIKAFSIIARRERRHHVIEGSEDGQDIQYGCLVVAPPMTEDEYLLLYGGKQPQPTSPILEQFRAELGLLPSNSTLQDDED